MILVSGFSVLAQGISFSNYLTGTSISLTPATALQLASTAAGWTFGSGALPVAGSSSSPANFGTDTQILLIGWSPNENESDLINLLGDGATWNPSSSMGSLDVGGPPVNIPAFDYGQGSIPPEFNPITGIQPATLNDISLSPEVQSVPEPSAFALAGAGLAILWVSRRRTSAWQGDRPSRF